MEMLPEGSSSSSTLAPETILFGAETIRQFAPKSSCRWARQRRSSVPYLWRSPPLYFFNGDLVSGHGACGGWSFSARLPDHLHRSRPRGSHSRSIERWLPLSAAGPERQASGPFLLGGNATAPWWRLGQPPADAPATRLIWLRWATRRPSVPVPRRGRSSG
jgi:hypothetical protein